MGVMDYGTCGSSSEISGVTNCGAGEEEKGKFDSGKTDLSKFAT